MAAKMNRSVRAEITRDFFVIPQQEEKAVNEPETKEKPIFKVTFDVIGDYETQHKVSDFLKSNGIAYKVVSQVKA